MTIGFGYRQVAQCDGPVGVCDCGCTGCVSPLTECPADCGGGTYVTDYFTCGTTELICYGPCVPNCTYCGLAMTYYGVEGPLSGTDQEIEFGAGSPPYIQKISVTATYSGTYPYTRADGSTGTANISGTWSQTATYSGTSYDLSDCHYTLSSVSGSGTAVDSVTGAAANEFAYIVAGGTGSANIIYIGGPGVSFEPPNYNDDALAGHWQTMTPGVSWTLSQFAPCLCPPGWTGTTGECVYTG